MRRPVWLRSLLAAFAALVLHALARESTATEGWRQHRWISSLVTVHYPNGQSATGTIVTQTPKMIILSNGQGSETIDLDDVDDISYAADPRGVTVHIQKPPKVEDQNSSPDPAVAGGEPATTPAAPSASGEHPKAVAQ